MNMVRQILKTALLTVATMLVVCGCSSYASYVRQPTLIDCSQVISNPAKYNNKAVEVRGYLMTDKLGSTTSVYPDAKDAELNNVYGAIDMYTTISLPKQLAFDKPTCVIVYGVFQIYQKGDIKFAPSNVGMIHAKSISLCTGS